ncbi:hypothetical protein D3C72_2500100 [compost metagenome]
MLVLALNKNLLQKNVPMQLTYSFPLVHGVVNEGTKTNAPYEHQNAKSRWLDPKSKGHKSNYTI